MVFVIALKSAFPSKRLNSCWLCCLLLLIGAACGVAPYPRGRRASPLSANSCWLAAVCPRKRDSFFSLNGLVVHCAWRLLFTLTQSRIPAQSFLFCPSRGRVRARGEPTNSWGRLWSPVRPVVSVCANVCGTRPGTPFTAHWLNMLPGQPHQPVCYATYQTDTCRRNYGMSIAGPNPDITRRPLVQSLSYPMSTSEGNDSLRSHAWDSGEEMWKISCAEFPF